MIVRVTDRFLHQSDEIMMYLFSCLHKNKPASLELIPDGPCNETTGLYRLLDNFSNQTGFDKSKIKISTANLLEYHDEYVIEKNLNSWAEIAFLYPKWMKNNEIYNNPCPQFHFGHFVGRSSWDRLWIASDLYNNHNEKTLQSFHSHLGCNYVIPESDEVKDTLGLELLNEYEYTDWENLVNFLKTCPKIIDDTEFDNVDGSAEYFIPPTNKNIYPIQHPANINMAKQYYPQIFADIVSESTIVGNAFTITEKTWRPILSRRPFILMSNLNSLQNLKKLGFETFEDYWAEDYDYYECGDRIKEIQSLVSHLSSMPLKEIHLMLKNMQPVLEHNYEVLKNLTVDKITKTFIK